MTIHEVLFTPIRQIGFNNRGICSILETADTIGKRGDLFMHIINIPDNVYPKVRNVGKITIDHIQETLNNFIDKNHTAFLFISEQDLITLGLKPFAVERIKHVLAKRKLTIGKNSYIIASANKNIKNCQKEISDLKQQIKDTQTQIALKEIEIIQLQK
ncbi:MAG: hypothetical protein R8M37_02975 [Alphaproteobacteria bacterium]|nr:hypothetical protein [Alphaproteobacteria bacterium]